MKTPLILAATLAATSLLTADLQALPGSSLRVASGESIQAAIDAAAPGDALIVLEGTYEENLVVPAGLRGLTITGLGRVVVDARPFGASGSGPGILIEAPDVTLKNLVVRHAKPFEGHGGKGFAGSEVPAGIYVAPLATGVTLTSVDVLGSWGDGIRVIADGATVESCTVDASAGWSLWITGDSGAVKRLKARSAGKGHVSITGRDATVAGARLSHAAVGIAIEGEDGAVTDSTISSVRTGLVMTGDGNMARNNALTCIETLGIELSGEGCRVLSNTVTGVIEGTGIAFGGYAAMVSRNKVREVNGTGLSINAGCVEVQYNQLIECGSPDAPATLIEARVSGDVRHNVVRRPLGVGAVLRGGGYVVVSNKVVDGLSAGIVVEPGEDVESDLPLYLVRNAVLHCQGDGLANFAYGTELYDNTLLHNRIDLTNAAWLLDTDNHYGTGGMETAPEIAP